MGILCTLWALLPNPAEAQTFSSTSTDASITCGPISPGVAANFSINGKVICQSGLIDWYSTSAACSGLLQITPPDSVNHPFPGLGPVLFVRDSTGASNGTDPTIFRGTSNTNGDLIGDPLLYPGQTPWTYTTGNPPQKDDLSEVYVTVQQDPLTGNLWLIVGGAYISTDGDKHFDFEFNQKGVHLDPSRGLIIGDGVSGGRTGGTNPDFVLSIDYQQGGAAPCVHIRTWNDTSLTYVERVKPASCTGDSAFSAVSGPNTPVPVPVFGTGSGYDVTDHYDSLQFAEAGVNLSCYLPGFNPAAFCGQVSTVMVKTRSSGSSPFDGAQLKDFVIAPFSFVQPPPVAINGPTTICAGSAAQFCETASPASSHQWTITSAPPGIATRVGADVDSSCATIQFNAAGTCTLKVAVTDPNGCISRTQTVITVNAAAVAAAGPDSSACSANGQFNFVAHGSGSGGTPSWSVVSGTANIVSGGSTFTPVVHVTTDAVLRLTVPGTAPCPPATDDVAFHVDTAPTAAAGPDSSACSPNGIFTFVGHGSGTNGTPSWSVVSGTASILSGGSTFTPRIQVTGDAVLRLTVTGAATCSPATDDVALHVDTGPTAAAGPDSSACSPNGIFTFVGHGSGSGGTPSWSVLSGTATILSGGSTFTPVIQVTGDATLRLTVTGAATCAPATDDVALHVDTAPTASAGPDSAACSPNGIFSFVAHGSGSNGTPSWSVISGTATILSGGSTFTPFVQVTGNATLRLTVTGAATCSPATDDVAFHVDTAPTANAGPDSTVCSVSGVYTFHLVGTGTNGTPAWTVISGTASILSGANTLTPVVQVTGGPATLRLTVTGAATCSPATDDVVLQVNTNPTASAGPDSAACSPNGIFTFVGHGSGSGGTPSWSVISGTASILSGGSTFTPRIQVTGDATLRLTVTSGLGCPPVSDDVAFHVDTAPTAAAGPDSSACSPNGIFAFVGHGSGSGGTPSWSVVSGTASILSGGSTFTPHIQVTGNAVLRLTVTGAATCSPATDDVAFHVDTAPTAAAGPDSSACAATNVFTFVAHGSGTNGTPSWSVISGTASILSGGSTFTPRVQVTGDATLRLTVTGAATCSPATDDVSFHVDAAPTANAGPDSSACTASGIYTFVAHGSGSGTPSWSVISGTATIVSGGSTFTPRVQVTGSATLRLTTTGAGTCPTTTDDVTFNVFASPVAAAGPDTSGCFTASGTLFHLHGTGTNGNCSWSVVSGTANILSPNSCLTDVVVTSGSATLRLTVTSAHAECSPATDDVVLTVNPLPTCQLNAPNPLPTCASPGNQLCAVNTSNVATYFWHVTSADAGWQITGGQGTNCITYTAGNGGTAAVFHLIVTSAAGCQDSCAVRDSCVAPVGVFCSLTQGAWGNATGKFGNETHLQVEQRVITPANPLVIGILKSVNPASFGSLTFVDGSEDCLIMRMPAGGPPATFPSNLGDQTLTDANGCTAGSLVFKNGRFGDVLIGQTIALSLNTRLDVNLGGLTLSTVMVSGSADPGPDGKFGTPDDICTGTDLRTVYISSRVLTALQNLGLPNTVNGLVILCNRALSGLDISPATVGDCNSAADAINEGFDECRCLVQSATVADNSGMATGGAQNDPFANGVKDFALAANTPNPFDHSTLIRFGLPVQAHVRVAVYNILGQQVALLTDGDFAPGVQSLVWDAKSHSGAPVAPGVYFARMRADTATRHFVQTRKMLFVK